MRSKVAVAFNNGIGNFVMFTPVLQLIAERVGDVDLFLDIEWDGEGKEAVRMMAENMPFVRKVRDYENRLQLDEYDSKYMSRHGRVDNFFQAVNEHITDWEKLPSWGGDLLHEIEFYVYEASDVLHMSPAICAQYVPHGKKPRSLPKQYVCFSNSYLRSKDGLWDKKSWNKWEEFTDTFLNYYDEMSVVLLGGLDDAEWGKKVREIDTNRITDMTNKTTILETAAIVKKAEALISTDTAVMHFADAFRVKGVALFGPSLVSKSGPWNGTILPVRSTRKCAACQGTVVFAKCQEWLCMDAIKPEMVMGAVRRILP